MLRLFFFYPENCFFLQGSPALTRRKVDGHVKVVTVKLFYSSRWRQTPTALKPSRRRRQLQSRNSRATWEDTAQSQKLEAGKDVQITMYTKTRTIFNMREIVNI